MNNKTARKFLPEFVYGGTDGVITTFAIVSGVSGAGLAASIVLILGFANLLADGFSMAVSNYLSTKSRNDVQKKKSNAKKTAFVTFVSFVVIGFIPLLSFILGAIFKGNLLENQFLYSAILAGLAFLLIGFLKGEVTNKNKLKSSLSTLVVGGIAAVIAFVVGALLKSLVG